MVLPFPCFKVVFLIVFKTLHSLSCEQINQSLDIFDAYKSQPFLGATCVSHVLMKHSEPSEEPLIICEKSISILS